MNDIKFKAYDTKNKEWLESVPPEEYMLDAEAWDDPEESDLMFDPQHPIRTFDNRIVYLPYVGMKDKNDKEIYEGDYVRVVVEQLFDDVVAVGVVTRPISNYHVQFMSCSVDLESLEDIEVIGNVYDNPELREEVTK